MSNANDLNKGDGTLAEAEQETTTSAELSLESLASALSNVVTSTSTDAMEPSAPAAHLTASTAIAGATSAAGSNSQVNALVAMGFAPGDATAALQMCDGDVELAAMQLLEDQIADQSDSLIEMIGKVERTVDKMEERQVERINELQITFEDAQTAAATAARRSVPSGAGVGGLLRAPVGESAVFLVVRTRSRRRYMSRPGVPESTPTCIGLERRRAVSLVPERVHRHVQ